jgi:hypothetical protein
MLELCSYANTWHFIFILHNLFVCLFWAVRAIFKLPGCCHYYQWQGCKFRPMLSAYGFEQWGFFYMPHLLRHRTSVFKIISERPVILTSEYTALGDGTITTYFNVLGLTRMVHVRTGLELETSRMLSKNAGYQ